MPMQEMKIDRNKFTESEGIFGDLTIGDLKIETLELNWHDNLPFISCIPYGTYSLFKTKSDKFGDVLRFRLVPQRTDVLVHPANYAGDKEIGYKTDLLGCVAPGMSKGTLDRGDGIQQQAILSSKVAMQKLLAVIEYEVKVLIYSSINESIEEQIANYPK